MNWRPEVWSRKRTDYLSDTDNSWLGCTIEAKRIYEAGADAMLKALKEEIKKSLLGKRKIKKEQKHIKPRRENSNDILRRSQRGIE